jgi:aquaporin Z
VGNTPFNPARATASAIFSNSWSLEQLWLFWVAPLVGAAIAGLVFRGFAETPAAVPARAHGTDLDADDDAELDVHDAQAGSDDDLDGDAADGTAGSGAAGRAQDGTAGTAENDARDFFDGKRGR